MASLEQVYNHVVLPPRLPGTQDSDSDVIARDLTTRLLRACQTLEELTGDNLRHGCVNLATMLQTSRQVNGEFVDQSSLLAAFDTVLASNSQVLVCYVNEQNAGLLIHRKEISDEQHVVVFEAFEASPTSESVLAAPNALRWDFPDRAVQVPVKTFQDAMFQEQVAVFIHKASSEYLSNFATLATKAGVAVPEIRNPSKPAIITHMFLSVLEAMGGAADVLILHKRVRDDVHLGGGEIPWRRLPFWLVLRVACQRQLRLSHGAIVGYAAYKLLMCITYAHLLDECISQRMHPVHVLLLQQKLGRKLAKLGEHLSAQEQTDDEAKSLESIMSNTSTLFETSISMAKKYVDFEYRSFKGTIRRRIPELPRRVPEDAYRLTLPSSGAYLTNLLQNLHGANVWTAEWNLALSPESSLAHKGGVEKTLTFANKTLDESRQLSDATAVAPSWDELQDATLSSEEAVALCEKISKAISSLVQLAASIPPSDPVHASSTLLCIFELWAKMDSVVLVLYPLLADYKPVFPPAILNVLQLPLPSDMKRLRYLQWYIGQRCTKSKLSQSILSSGNDSSSFGVRITEQSPDLQDLYSTIKAAQTVLRLKKAEEWLSLSTRYETASEKILSLPCCCSFYNGKRNVRGCERCYIWRQRKKLAIDVCENLLPDDETLARAIVFELRVPECFAIYRATTLHVLAKLACPRALPAKGSPKALKLAKNLTRFATFVGGSSVTMASNSKSFAQTHYASLKMPVTMREVLLPFAARFNLFDEATGHFVSDFLDKPPTLAHRCSVHVPESLRHSVVPVSLHPPTYPRGPSSYTTIASRPQCPSDLSAHEFEAFQRLLSGRARRWLTILVELGSANLNFSEQDLVLLLSNLALEAGPPLDQNAYAPFLSDDHRKLLGVVHFALADNSFVHCLLGQLKIRLDSIRGNWRETNTMDLLITMILRVLALVQDDAQRDQALSLLDLARSTTLDWTETLRGEIAGTTDSNNAHRASMYAFQAALLCRRTFAVFVDGQCGSMGSEQFLCYVKASIALQQSLVVDVAALKPAETAMLKRDITMANALRGQISSAILAHPESMNEGVSYGIGLVFRRLDPGTDAENNHFSPWKFHRGANDGWVSTVIQPTGPNVLKQQIDFHYTGGHILVNGKTMGKLPDNIRESDQVKELFQEQHLLVYPSTLRGMSHRLMTLVDRQAIHFGARDGTITILAQNNRGDVYQFIPRRTFYSESGVYDLPRGLVDDCYHWFNRTTRLVEIRPSWSKWRHRLSNWALNVPRRTAQRNNVNLVDPHSHVALSLKKIFSNFEDGQRLTVFQPNARQGALSVELRHLDLSFSVNWQGHLVCRELNAEIDPNQDAGTLYGYQSMIVLRDCIERTSRSIILPLGDLRYAVLGVHVVVQTELDLGPRGRNSANGQAGKAYGRFGIDNTLGRLTCPPEPRLLYTKALLHAYTSCPIPDSLTGRTGDEEAVHTLLSGRCQPWMPFNEASTPLFKQLKSLAPKRAFYPPDKRVLQKVTWDARLPLHLQNDRYGRIVQILQDKSADLDQFFAESMATTESTDARKKNEKGNVLERRAEIQRRRFQCPTADLEPCAPVVDEDLAHKSRGCVCLSGDDRFLAERSLLVSRIGKLLVGGTDEVPMENDIKDILETWSPIGGFGVSRIDVAAMPISSFLTSTIMSEQWGALLDMCRQGPLVDVMLALGQMSFASHTDSDIIHMFAAYCRFVKLSELETPSHEYFLGFRYQQAPTEKTIHQLVKAAYVEFEYAPTQTTGWRAIEAEMKAQREEHNRLCSKDGSKLAKILLSQWPDCQVVTSAGFNSDYIDVQKALATVQPEWTRLRNNHDLSTYVHSLQKELAPYRTKPKNGTKHKTKSSGSTRESKHKLVPHTPTFSPSLSRDLVRRDVPDPCSGPLETAALPLRPKGSIMPPQKPIMKAASTSTLVLPPEYTELRQIVSSFTESPDPMREAYGTDLAGSLDALEAIHRQHREDRASVSDPVPTLDQVFAQVARAKEELALIQTALETSFSSIRADSVEPTTHSRNWLKMVDLWPRLTPVSLLELLRSSGGHVYGNNVQSTLVTYGCALTKLQRLQRIRRALQRRDDRRLNDELRNHGHTNWRPIDLPDWLLLEIDADLLIREEQVDVARAIIDPQSKSNSVMQLNMGKGKTSVIVPMVIAVLANGQQMCRLVVPKALLLPTAQPVQSQLGGLVGRELRHLPFSRRLASSTNIDQVMTLFKFHHEDLLQKRGVLLVAPEHVMAFTLSGRQCLVDGKQRPAGDLIGFQEKLTNGMCRDILDESDFTLAVRTQLVYPSGQLTAVDGAPYRWKLIECLLSLVEDNLADLCAKYPHCISTLPRPGGGFPMVYVLQSGIEDELNERIIDGICNGQIPSLRPAADKYEAQRAKSASVVAPVDFQRAMKKALSSGGTDADVDDIAELFPDAQSAVNGLTLVRGLLYDGILLTCLKKRWNVNYGLHPKRWPIAVPFEAKGVPSERSEYGHPDVSIILTCLSFYYTGLNKSQFREGLQHVLHHADDPATEYEQWTAGNNATPLPLELRSWNAINVDDAGQLQSLWDHLRSTRPVIDHYLNTFVFPIHSRQFSVKLQTSSWDLPLFPLQEEGLQTSSRARTTGFSGTNDNKMMLPLTIKQEDLPGLRQTNAEVLTYLLQGRSRRYIRTGAGGRRWAEDILLISLKENGIRVFIDAGAYILEKDNEALARTWLQVDSKASAAVFFGEKDNRAWVVFKTASIAKAPLLATPFVDKLDQCLVYFDEAHTRGVDLQLPASAVGALTLALGQTKDHTVQAAMRLRQLGTTQSVMFYAPPEVDQSIRDVCGKNGQAYNGPIWSPHVVHWLLEQTCLANKQLQPLYTSHGMDFCRRMDAQRTYGDWQTNSDALQSLLKVLEQPERQTIQQLYGAGAPVLASANKDALRLPVLRSFVAELDALHHNSQQAVLGGRRHANGAFEEVEQEREVEHQVEQERTPQKPWVYDALQYPGVSEAIRAFVHTGNLSGRVGYEQVFAYIAGTGIGKRYGVRKTKSRLFVSTEFGRTIANFRRDYDDYMRPVEWLLWSPKTKTGIVVIPEEVEDLLPILWTSSSQVHLVACSVPVTRSMRAFSSLQFYALPSYPAEHTLPPWLVVELGILAGRLYMSYDEAVSMSQYLRGAMGLDEKTANNGSSSSESQPFCSDPIGFLLEWLPLRRGTQDIMHTPAGYICQGRPLMADNAFFSEPGLSQPSKRNGSPDKSHQDQVDDDESDGGGGIDWEDAYVPGEEDDVGQGEPDQGGGHGDNNEGSNEDGHEVVVGGD